MDAGFGITAPFGIESGQSFGVGAAPRARTDALCAAGGAGTNAVDENGLDDGVVPAPVVTGTAVC